MLCLQVACALLLAGETNVAKFEAAKEVLVQMGTYFQVQVFPRSMFFNFAALHAPLNGSN